MSDTTIVATTARRIWDPSRLPALAIEIELAGGATGTAVAALSTGFGELGGIAYGATRVTAAIAGVNGLVQAALHGVDARRQADVDATLFKLDSKSSGETLGKSVIAACSIAAARAAANASGQPLFRHLRASPAARLPLPLLEVLRIDSMGQPGVRAVGIIPFLASDAGEALDLGASVDRILREAFARPPRSDREAIEAVVEATETAGYAIGAEVGLSVEIGAHRFFADGHYSPGGEPLGHEAWAGRLLRLLDEFPIAAFEDPFADPEGMAFFTELAGSRTRIVANEFVASDAERIETAAADRLCSAALLSVESAGTISELRVAFLAAHRAGWTTMLSATGQSGIDAAAVHVAAAWGAGFLKLGRPAGTHWASVWNETLQVESLLRPAPIRMPVVETIARLVH